MKSQDETLAGWAFLPIIATISFYFLPSHWQSSLTLQFIPQVLAFVIFGLWASSNQAILPKLGLDRNKFFQGLRYGMATGLLLGSFNTWVILEIIPLWGNDYAFLRETPHAHIPIWIMVPWFIIFIALMVEVNFRGFLLGRLLHIFGRLTRSSKERPKTWNRPDVVLAVSVSAVIFSFDPFMVHTFQHLHWIALWDGLIWGWLRVHLNNLYTVIIAHAVEVLILYLFIRETLS